ncbi:MAG: hypothetical protein J6L64_04915 [Opitutales bacterium]|nr:hypothetical protein [Opitutales bacterium]
MLSGQKTANLLRRAGIWLLKKFWIFLALLLLVQIGLLYISVSEIRIPDAIVKKFLKKTESEGFYISIGDVRLRNLTVITAKEIDIGTSRGNDPFLHLRRCAIKLGPDALISGKPFPQFFYIDGAEFFCPSVISPTGKAEQIFSDGTLILRKKDEKIMIDAAEFLIGDAKFVAYGEIPVPALISDFENKSSLPPPEVSAPSGEKPSVIISRFAGKIAEKLHALNLRPLLNSCEFVAEIRPDGNALGVEVSAFCENFDFRENVSLEKISAKQTLSVNFSANEILFTEPFCLFAELGNFTFGELFSEKIQVSAKHISVAAEIPKNIFNETVPVEEKIPQTLFSRVEHLRVATLCDGIFDAESVLLVVSPEEKFTFPGSFSVNANLASGTTTLACAGTVFADAEKAALDLNYEISLDKNLLTEFPQLRAVTQNEEMRALHFTEQPTLRGNVKFDSGMDFRSLDFELIAGETQGNNFHLCALDVAGTLLPTEIRLAKIVGEGTDFCAKADAFFEFADDGKFRVRAWGSVNPEYIDGRLGWFWERIWRDLKKAPSEQSPRADIDVYGRWNENWEYVFGAIAGEKCYGNGILVDNVRLRVYEDPLLISAFDMHITRGNDFADGCLQWHYAMEPKYHYRDFRFLFNGKIPPKDVLQIIGEGLPEALSDIEAKNPATGKVRGFFSGDPELYTDRIFVEIKGAAPGEFSVFGIRGENFRGEIVYDNGVVLVGNPFHADAGRGSVSGKIRVDLPENGQGTDDSIVELDLNLRNVSRSRLVKTLEAVGSRVGVASSGKNYGEKPVPAVPVVSAAAANPEKAAHFGTFDKSSIDATFRGSLVVPEISSLDAEGTFFIHDEDLFELQIFGGFSRLLSSLKIDLTTFLMDRAESSYAIRDGVILLPDTRIYGESGEINLQADVVLSDFSIQGEAVFRNLRGTEIPLLGKLVEWGSASTELLPVKISGTVDKPDWKLTTKLSRIWDWINPASLLKLPKFIQDDSEENK